MGTCSVCWLITLGLENNATLVTHCCREYIPADCLIDGEQNDSAEVLELLCSTLTTELAKCTDMNLLQQAQTAWQTLPTLRNCTGPASHRAFSNQQHAPHVGDIQHTLQQSAPEESLGNLIDNHRNIQSQLDQAELNCMPLQGNIAGDMVCLKCQHSFESQHTPFLLLPLALPTAQVQLTTNVLCLCCTICLPAVIPGLTFG